jgi:ABC-type nitrate/sulfonate/bicarbonate transport system ATPase subunit
MTIIFKDISKTFSKNSEKEIAALENISFDIGEHEFISIVGPSGCGKTTFLKIVAGLLKQDSGTIYFSGVKNPNTALVFQDQGLLPWLNVMENIGLGLELNRVQKDERRKKVLDFMKVVKLEGFEKHYPHEISGGMRQRVALARAFLANPDLLLMDEPFGALDAQTRIILQEELLNLWKREQKTVLFVTHDVDEAILLSDQVILMSNRPGKIQKIIRIPFGRPRNLLLKDDKEFVEIRRMIWKLLENEVRQELMLS